MTTLQNTKTKCANCGGQNSVDLHASTNSFGPADLDGRPAAMFRHTLTNWLQECARCGYVSVDIGASLAGSEQVIEGHEFKALNLHPRESDFENRCLKASLFNLHAGNYVQAGRCALWAAWSADDNSAIAEAIEYRNSAIKTLEIALHEEYTKKNDTTDLRLRMVDILRRAQRWQEAQDQAEQLAQQVPGAFELKILKFQTERAAAHDSNCYSIDDAT